MYKQVIKFWFEDIDESSWFRKSETFDQKLISIFSELHKQAVACELSDWRQTALGSLAEIIILDQFSRNMFRDKPESFLFDGQALVLAQVAIEKGLDKELSHKQRTFMYMPFMHSESAKIHQQAVELFTSLGRENNLKYEMMHKSIIDRFGRYPHRNEILGRKSTAEELEFLKTPGSSF